MNETSALFHLTLEFTTMFALEISNQNESDGMRSKDFCEVSQAGSTELC